MQLCEKYRPQDWNEVKGQEHIVISLKEILAKAQADPDNKPPHMLFIGPAGTGKNTVAQIFAKHYLQDEYGEKYKTYFREFNSSDARKIDNIREEVKPISRLAVDQVVNLTEADGMTPQSQDAMRRIMETTRNTIFIFDCNNESKIIDPIKSRCAEFRFKPLNEEIVLNRLIDVAEAEGVQLKWNDEEREGFTAIYKLTRGDLRKAINELEKIITAKKEINAKSVLEHTKVNLVIDSVYSALNGDFEKAKNQMEDAFIISKQNVDIILGGLLEAVSKVENQENKIRLYYELGELEHKIQTTHNPIIPLIAFISYVWIVPHLRR